MMHFFDVRRKRKSDFAEEFTRLMAMLNAEAIPSGMRRDAISLIQIAQATFFNSKFRGTCATVDDLYEEVLPGWREGRFKMDLQNFLLFAETTFNLIAEIGDSVRGADYSSLLSCYRSSVEAKIADVLITIDRALDKIGYEMRSMDSEDCSVAVKKEEILNTIAEEKPTLQSLIVGYRRAKSEKDIEARRSILNEIAREIDPLLSDGQLKIRCGRLISDISCALNNFHIRHNNREDGKWVKPAMMHLKDSDVVVTFDALFDMIIALITESKATAAIEQVQSVMKIVCAKGK